MSKGLKKILTLMMVVVMALALAAGCNPSEPTGDPTDDPGPATDAPTTEPEEVRDLADRTIKVAAWWDMEPEEGTPGGDRQLARREEMQAKYNFTFEYVIDEWEMVNETYSSSVLSGTPFADIATLEDNWLLQHVKLNEVSPLENLIDFSDESKWDPMTRDMTTYDGHVYGMATGKWWPRAMFFFNKRIFDDAGIPYPYELLDSKEWTFDKVKEIAIELTKDTTGDGTIDQWGLAGIDMDVSMVYSNGGEMATYTDGVATINLRESNVQNALQTFWDWCNVDQIVFNKFDFPVPEGEDIPWDLAKRQFNDGNIGMFWYQYWSVDQFSEEMADDYGIILPPIGPDDPDQSYKAVVSGHNFQTIPNNVTNPEDIAFIWDKWTEPFEEDLENPDSWKEAHEEKLRDDESIDILEYMYEENAYVPIGIFGIKNTVEPWWAAQDDLLKGEKTVAQVIDEQFDALQAGLDDYLTD
ncbi:MAG TPA: hypothetical protein VFD33_00610 [Bacillota bacterium]|nr:hypothetical protein [Bacillota bacterium]